MDSSEPIGGGDVPCTTTNVPKRKRAMIEDDFFSLLSGVAKKPKKHRKKRIPHEIVSETVTNETPEISASVENIPGSPLKSQVSDSHVKDDEESITPPPEMDREALRSIIEERIKAKDIADIDRSALSDDNDSDEIDLDFFKPTKSESPKTDVYQFNEENEKQRRYIIRVLTKLPTPKDYDPNTVAEFGTRGIKKFGRILEAIVEYYRVQFKGTRRLDPVYLSQYTPENTALIWIDGKCEMKSFFKPCTFRIPPQTTFDITTNKEVIKPTNLNCLLIPREKVSDFHNIYPEFNLQEIGEDVVNDEDDVQVVEGVENLDFNNEVLKDKFFVIGLKGKDNKKIEVQVSPETVIKNLLIHYLKTKNIDLDSVNMKNVKLIFDDEEMDLDAVVGDTELEEDFEVQVVI